MACSNSRTSHIHLIDFYYGAFFNNLYLVGIHVNCNTVVSRLAYDPRISCCLIADDGFHVGRRNGLIRCCWTNSVLLISISNREEYLTRVQSSVPYIELWRGLVGSQFQFIFANGATCDVQFVCLELFGTIGLDLQIDG